MAYIEFNDGVLTQATNGLPAPGDRFSGWTPDVPIIGTREHGLGNGIPYINPIREDYIAKLTILCIVPSRVNDFLRLTRWLNRGGGVTIYTQDLAARSYPCHIAPGGTAQLSDPDDFYEQTFTVTLRNDSNANMLCVYSA